MPLIGPVLAGNLTVMHECVWWEQSVPSF